MMYRIIIRYLVGPLLGRLMIRLIIVLVLGLRLLRIKEDKNSNYNLDQDKRIIKDNNKIYL